MKELIIKADFSYLEACSEILKDSDLGQMYFVGKSGEYRGTHLLKEGFEKEEIYVSVNEAGACTGFIWLQLRGMFHWFPFIHVVVVAKAHRGKGISRQLMAHADDLAKEDRSDRMFLMVGSYNDQAISVYRHMGYEQVGEVPELFVKGINELLMMKLY